MDLETKKCQGPNCEHTFKIPAKQGKHKRFCSDTCRVRAWYKMKYSAKEPSNGNKRSER